MTREEAIKVLRTESIELGGNAVSVCRFLEALDMAIAALREQEGKDTYAPTNADHIRSMTDEELANIIECPYGNPYFDEHLPCKGSCHDCLLIWLKQPAEEDDHEY